MVSRRTVTTLTLALGLALTGCTGQSGSTPDASPSEASTTPAGTQSADPTGSPAPTKTAAEEEVELPDFMEPYPDAEVISSSRAAAESGELDAVSLVMRAQAEPKDIISFYTDRLEKAGFETFGKESMTKSAQVVNFRHKDNDGVLVITVSDDPDDPKASIVSLGGNIAP
ncbi:hypothetical protein [Brevibacterium casei]|uniref:hypothetical protein n=1 Tax=Brevibacterium casei TaxID=33889 RepID=UPI0036FA6EA7